MADHRFHRNVGPLSLGRIAELAGAMLAPGVDATRAMRDVAPLETAGPEELSFLDNPRYASAFSVSRAGAVIVAPAHAERAPAGMALLLSPTPYKAYALAARAFYPRPRLDPGVAPNAVVNPTAKLGREVSVAPGAVIGAGTRIGDRTAIGANCVIDAAVEIGADCLVGAQVALSHCLVGARVTLHPGVKIGQDGFGFAPDPKGHVKVPQLGRVIIGDDCEIGANTTIDRGAGPDTVIGAGTWIDNLVQVGHNVRIGRGCIIAAQTGISGSSRLGDFVMIGGQGGLAGHLSMGDGARLAAKSGLMHDVPPGATFGGIPAVPMVQHHREVATLQRLARERRKGAKGDA
jgi:UDP-3-O-[3-hydroxymyristoyl] glucosamine N-acyltransferase